MHEIKRPWSRPWSGDRHAHHQSGEFKAKWLKDEVAESGEPVVITKNGKPIAQLGPVGRARRSIWGLHKGQIEILGDIIEPIDVEWEANRWFSSTRTAWSGGSRRMRMGRSARGLADAAIGVGELAVSVISFWEIALLVTRGRLRAREDVTRWRHELHERGIVELPLGG